MEKDVQELAIREAHGLKDGDKRDKNDESKAI